MSQVDTHTTGTRERLLEVACELFAEKGYRGTSISEITGRAGANKASVNYHFGSKEQLYQEAWRRAHEQLLEQVPPDGGVAPDAPPEQRLRGKIRAGLQRCMARDNTEFRIMRNELANHTGLLHQVIEDTIRPLREATQAILRELLGPAATQQDIELCEICVVAPWMHMRRRSQAEQHKGLGPVFGEDMLEPMVEHFLAYALAGIAKTRENRQASLDATPERQST